MDRDPKTIFYDGDCALCHGAVKFILPRDRREVFDFAPIGGATYFKVLGSTPGSGVPGAPAERLPDSILVRRSDGSTLMRSAAVLHILERLGGGWRAMAVLASAVPRSWRDWAYDRVASVRRRLFGAPPGACPLVPPELRHRLRV